MKNNRIDLDLGLNRSHSHSRRPTPAIRVILFAMLSGVLLAMSQVTMAGPGAHGPNGEHLDAPVTMHAGSSLPRVEAASEAFELVAELRDGTMTIILDRYETNEPVAGARIEVESGALKAVAEFRAAQGDYVVADPALLKALAVPGEHGLVFTIVAGQESDLLDATLPTAPAGVTTGVTTSASLTRGGDGHGHSHDHDHTLARIAWIGAGVAALGLIGGLAWRRGRQRNRQRGHSLRGGL